MLETSLLCLNGIQRQKLCITNAGNYHSVHKRLTDSNFLRIITGKLFSAHKFLAESAIHGETIVRIGNNLNANKIKNSKKALCKCVQKKEKA